MKYNEVKIYTTTSGIEPLTDILMNHEVVGFEIEDSKDFIEFLDKKNTYDWDYVDENLMNLKDTETKITFYLEQNDEDDKRLQLIKEDVMKLKSNEMEGFFGEIKTVGKDGFNGETNVLGRLYVESNTVDDSDWKDNWKQYFKPVKITDRIVIKPTWQKYEKQKDHELIIEIDPGMAFGTGSHPTTSLCVKLLEKYIEKGDCVLDVGCGSGILSMAAALLNTDKVVGIEIDPIAVNVAKDNIKLNGLSEKIDVLEGDLTKGLSYSADIVAANLMADLVIMLTEDIVKHLKGKSIYISSGILIEKKEKVASVIEKCGFEILEILEDDEWCAIAARLINK
ncbi:50S ribosomal protein L11 methyltransferase [Anaerovorax odorimutans]|uniref:50S ribosomal protein L11 methyltransferase n=1 Tax=Anaerovorax odorimutans TaxID=109327 RepID=UPI0004251B1B|nr:50S ribosomal protein L11 methyltransferase [Anaerovorax odorimutans]